MHIHVHVLLHVLVGVLIHMYMYTCMHCALIAGIVYCLSRKDTEQVSRELSQHGIKAACYHADMAAEERTSVHMQWLKNKLQVTEGNQMKVQSMGYVQCNL